MAPPVQSEKQIGREDFGTAYVRPKYLRPE
jgi:hypothetical protein